MHFHPAPVDAKTNSSQDNAGCVVKHCLMDDDFTAKKRQLIEFGEMKKFYNSLLKTKSIYNIILPDNAIHVCKSIANRLKISN